MATPIYPALVTLRGPGPDALPIDATTPLAVAPQVAGAPVSSTNPQPVATPAFMAEVSFSRTADTNAYAALDVIGQNNAGSPGTAIQEFTSIGLSGGHIIITDLDLEIDIAAIPSGMTSFRLHLYDAAPAAILDNAAFDLGATAADRAKYLGYIDIAIPQDLGSTLYSQNVQVNKKVKLAAASTSLFGVLQTTGAWTPASGSVFKQRMHAIAA